MKISSLLVSTTFAIYNPVVAKKKCHFWYLQPLQNVIVLEQGHGTGGTRDTGQGRPGTNHPNLLYAVPLWCDKVRYSKREGPLNFAIVVGATLEENRSQRWSPKAMKCIKSISKAIIKAIVCLTCWFEFGTIWRAFLDAPGPQNLLFRSTHLAKSWKPFRANLNIDRQFQIWDWSDVGSKFGEW